VSAFDTIDEAKRAIMPYCYPQDEDTTGIVLNMNDTWGWATAWGEDVPDDKIEELANLIWWYGNAGTLYWVSEQHGQMRSEFHDINRFVDFVRNEERLKKEVPNSSQRAYKKLTYTLGGDGLWGRLLARLRRVSTPASREEQHG
jgi:hypothetical protein